MSDKGALAGLIKEKLQNKNIKRACIGLDGFVDRILHVVDKRLNVSEYTRVLTLREYGTRIFEAAGMSLNIEMIPVRVKYGGNGPIMAYAISLLGIETVCIGAFGKQAINCVFTPLTEKMQLYSYTDPAYTDAIEFNDGKIISSVLKTLNETCWEELITAIDLSTIIDLFDKSDLIALNNWTMMPRMTEIWKIFLIKFFQGYRIKTYHIFRFG